MMSGILSGPPSLMWLRRSLSALVTSLAAPPSSLRLESSLQTSLQVVTQPSTLRATSLAASANPTQCIMDNWWKEAVNVFNFASGNWDQFSSTVDTIPSSYWDPLWNFCNGDGNAEVTSAELTACGAKAAAWAGMSDSTQTFLYNFAAKYWSTVDQNGSGSLDYDEFRYTLAGFAAVDARVILAGFDGDSNGILDAG